MTHRIWSHTLSRQTMSLVCSTQTRKNTLANIPIQDTCVTWSQLTILPYPRFVKIPKTIDHQLYQNLCKGYIQSLQNLCLENFQLFKIRITQRLVVVVDLSGVEEICEVIEKEHHRAHRGPKDMRPQLLEKLYFPGISSITCNELSSCECWQTLHIRETRKQPHTATDSRSKLSVRDTRHWHIHTWKENIPELYRQIHETC